MKAVGSLRRPLQSDERIGTRNDAASQGFGGGDAPVRFSRAVRTAEVASPPSEAPNLPDRHPPVDLLQTFGRRARPGIEREVIAYVVPPLANPALLNGRGTRMELENLRRFLEGQPGHAEDPTLVAGAAEVAQLLFDLERIHLAEGEARHDGEPTGPVVHDGVR